MPSVQLFVDRASAVRTGLRSSTRRRWRRRRRDRAAARRPAAGHRAGRRPDPGPAGRRGRRAAVRPVPAADRRPPDGDCPGTRRCGRSSSGAGTCSPPDERLLAERLSVFPAGATTEQRHRGLRRRPPRRPTDVPGLLGSLVDKSLLTVDESHGLRYRMLETIREYGIDRLAERGEVDEARPRHATFFADLVVGPATTPLRTPEQLDAARVLDAEHDNMLAALRFLGDSGDAAAHDAAGARAELVLVARRQPRRGVDLARLRARGAGRGRDRRSPPSSARVVDAADSAAWRTTTASRRT